MEVIKTKYLSIDPGTSNLGWAFGTTAHIDEAGVDAIWVRGKSEGIREGVRQATVAWYKTHHHYFEAADRVLVELQFTSSKTLGIFPPMVVMDTILSCCDLEFPGKATHVSARAVKQRFGISGDYADRKSQVVERVGLKSFPGRMHDIADCILMMEYDAARKAPKDTLALAVQRKKAERAALREKSPKRK
jgi:hypothetical protein